MNQEDERVMAMRLARKTSRELDRKYARMGINVKAIIIPMRLADAPVAAGEEIETIGLPCGIACHHADVMDVLITVAAMYLMTAQTAGLSSKDTPELMARVAELMSALKGRGTIMEEDH